MKGLKSSFMKIEFENSIKRLSFLRHLPDIKISKFDQILNKKRHILWSKSLPHLHIHDVSPSFIAVAF